MQQAKHHVWELQGILAINFPSAQGSLWLKLFKDGQLEQGPGTGDYTQFGGCLSFSFFRPCLH